MTARKIIQAIETMLRNFKQLRPDTIVMDGLTVAKYQRYTESYCDPEYDGISIKEVNSLVEAAQLLESFPRGHVYLVVGEDGATFLAQKPE